MDMFTKACAGKHGYPNFGAASGVIRSRRKKEKKGGLKLAVYRCSFCHLWHVGSSRRSAVPNGA